MVASLQSAVEALAVCVESIYDLIEHVDQVARTEAEPPARHRRALVSYGGGVSPLASLEGRARPATGPIRVSRAVDHPRTDGPTTLLAGHDDDSEPTSIGPGSPALMAATDLAHRGYSREEIRERLRDRWGDRAMEILDELME